MVISKCTGTACEKASKCLRYTIEALPKYQPWIVQQVSVPDTTKCRFFISNEEKDNGSED